MKVLIIDNYDSFTYNLYQYAGEILQEKTERFSLEVLRNNEASLEEIRERAYDRIIISPGPGHPGDSAYFGVCKDVLLELGSETPILGVCLGMQGMALYYGGQVERGRVPMHGKTSPITHQDEEYIFKGLPENLDIMRYHSLVVTEISDQLEVTARVADEFGEIMGIRHKTRPIFGIQFHPESFATEGGQVMLRNFFELDWK